MCLHDRCSLAMPAVSVAAYWLYGSSPHASLTRCVVCDVSTSEATYATFGWICSRPASCSSARAPAKAAYEIKTSGCHSFSCSTVLEIGWLAGIRSDGRHQLFTVAATCEDICQGLMEATVAIFCWRVKLMCTPDHSWPRANEASTNIHSDSSKRKSPVGDEIIEILHQHCFGEDRQLCKRAIHETLVKSMIEWRAFVGIVSQSPQSCCLVVIKLRSCPALVFA